MTEENRCHLCGKDILDSAMELCQECYDNLMRSQEEEAYQELERQEEYHRWLREEE
jgi:ribosome-binding protein aMBF1 (putative translation factor)